MPNWHLQELRRQRAEVEQDFAELEKFLEDLVLDIKRQCAKELVVLAVRMSQLPLAADRSGDISLRSSDIIYTRARKIVWSYEDALKREKILRRELALQKENLKRHLKTLDAKISELIG